MNNEERLKRIEEIIYGVDKRCMVTSGPIPSLSHMIREEEMLEIHKLANEASKSSVKDAMNDAEKKAWDSLSRYKFLMFGYHAARWVSYNRLLCLRGRKRNPFRGLVKSARSIDETVPQ